MGWIGLGRHSVGSARDHRKGSSYRGSYCSPPLHVAASISCAKLGGSRPCTYMSHKLLRSWAAGLGGGYGRKRAKATDCGAGSPGTHAAAGRARRCGRCGHSHRGSSFLPRSYRYRSLDRCNGRLADAVSGQNAFSQSQGRFCFPAVLRSHRAGSWGRRFLITSSLLVGSVVTGRVSDLISPSGTAAFGLLVGLAAGRAARFVAVTVDSVSGKAGTLGTLGAAVGYIDSSIQERLFGPTLINFNGVIMAEWYPAGTLTAGAPGSSRLPVTLGHVRVQISGGVTEALRIIDSSSERSAGPSAQREGQSAMTGRSARRSARAPMTLMSATPAGPTTRGSTSARAT